MNADRRWLHLVLPLMVLALCVMALRRMPPVEGSGDAGPNCDTRQSTDIATLERCLERTPSAVEVLIDLGLAYEASGRVDRAEAAYRRAIAADSRSADAHVRLGRLLLARQDAAGALREADEAGRMQPARLAVRQLASQAAREGSAR